MDSWFEMFAFGLDFSESSSRCKEIVQVSGGGQGEHAQLPRPGKGGDLQVKEI